MATIITYKRLFIYTLIISNSILLWKVTFDPTIHTNTIIGQIADEKKNVSVSFSFLSRTDVDGQEQILL